MEINGIAKGYGSYDNAIKKLDRELKSIGRSRDDARWLVSVNQSGRFVPTVVPNSGDVALFVPLAYVGVSIVN